MQLMRILQAGNANFGYVMARELRKRGIESELLVSKQIISGQINSVNNPFNLDKQLKGSYPEWLHFYDLSKKGWQLQILRMMRKYDIIHAYMELPILSMLSRKPYLAQSGGDDLRELAFSNSFKGRLLRRAYKKANAFVYVWPPHKTYVEKLKLKNPIYIPRTWDISNFSNKKYEPSLELPLKIFHPTGQDWEMKGNYKFLKAFIRLCKEKQDVFLYYVKWGKDVSKASKLLDDPDVKKRIHFILGPISREEMTEYMSKSDILVDQFNSGSFTRTGIESFAFGIPLMLNLDEKLHEELHGEIPSIINAQTEDKIYDQLKKYVKSKDGLLEIGINGQKWGNKYFNLEKNVEKFIEIYKNILHK